MRRSVGETPRISVISPSNGNDRDWTYAVGRLERLLPYVFDVDAARSGETITLTGNVMSEDMRDVIEEVFRDYDPAARIRNDLEVTAPFRSAARDVDDFETDAVPAKREMAVDRYPHFGSEASPSVGERFRFFVDLTPAANDQPPFRMELPSDWSTVIVDVEIISAQLRFEDDASRRKIVIESDGRSLSARFEAEVVGVTDAGLVEVKALFNCMGRFSGTGRSSFKVAERTEERTTSPQAGKATQAVSVDRSAIPPDLNVEIFGAGTPVTWIWVLRAPKAGRLGMRSRREVVTLDDPKGFATGLISRCPNLPGKQHAGALRGIGEKIWAAAPETFRSLYKDMRERFGSKFSIQFVTDEPHVPWEMMHPNAQSGIAEPDHLFMTHPVSRWYAEVGGRFTHDFGGSIASFVPDYQTGRPPLPAAIEEGKWLVSTLGAEPMDPTWQNFTSFWSTNMPPDRVAVLHFAGHGENEPTPRIRMLKDFVSCDEVNGSVKLGERDHPFVVLNACETGAAQFKLGLVSGWAASLTEAEFGGVLAPLWKVEDECASQVVRSYLGDFRKGVRIGLAMQRARASRRNESATPFAYVCYGDVNARMF